MAAQTYLSPLHPNSGRSRHVRYGRRSTAGAQHARVSLQQRISRVQQHWCLTWRAELTWAAHKLGQEICIHSLGEQSTSATAPLLVCMRQGRGQAGMLRTLECTASELSSSRSASTSSATSPAHARHRTHASGPWPPKAVHPGGSNPRVASMRYHSPAYPANTA